MKVLNHGVIQLLDNTLNRATFYIKAPMFVSAHIDCEHHTVSNEYYVPHVSLLKNNVNAQYLRELMTKSNHDAFDHYKELIALDCPPRIALSVLPLGQYNVVIATLTPQELIKLSVNEVYEVRVYAEAMMGVLDL